MKQSKMLSTKLVLLLFTAVTASEYYVSAPNGEPCPATIDLPCHNLSFYSDDYFTDDTIFYFLEGTHTLQRTLKINGVSNLTLQGLESALHLPQLQCTGNNSGLLFANTNDVNISNLLIVKCGHQPAFQTSNEPNNNGAMTFVNSSYILLQNTQIFNSTGIGLLVVNSINVTIVTIIMKNNGKNLVVIYNEIESCSNVTFQFRIKDNSVFIGGEVSFNLSQSCDYNINIFLDGIIIRNSNQNNLVFYVCTNSAYSLQMNNVTCMDAQSGSGISIVLDTLCTTNYYQKCCLNKQGDCNINISGSHFEGNNASLSGQVGGISVSLNGPVPLCRQSILIDSCSVINNFGRYSGIGILSLYSIEVTIRNSILDRNRSPSISFPAALVVYTTMLTLENVTISNSLTSAGILMFSSTAVIQGTNNVIENNNGSHGGGIGLHENSRIRLDTADAKLMFYNNIASEFGGALFLGRSNTLFSITDCFVKVASYTPLSEGLYFSGNRATIAGNDIFGLIGDQCLHTPVFNPPLQNLSISSRPIGVCLCDNASNLNCNVRNLSRVVLPGTTIYLSIVPVGHAGGNNQFSKTLGTIRTTKNGGTPRPGKRIEATCEIFQYRAVTNQMLDPINITITTSESSELYNSSEELTITLEVTFESCPYGFQFSNSTYKCECNPSLVQAIPSLQCNATTKTFSHDTEIWIGTFNDNERMCLVAYHCSYCTSRNVTFTLETEDRQCGFDHSGLLCGQCAEGLSLMLGSSQCGQCNNGYIALIIPFALAGIALVVFLFALNLTVSVGTINGLIFYINVVKLCEDLFLPNNHVPIITQFISWFNLDLGIQTCFYNGMDAYGKTWLQIVFPSYIWLLMLLIVIICQKSSVMTRLLGKNVIPVLATLLLLSYTKLFRMIADALSNKNVHVINCQNKLVWAIDPTLDYFQRKHIALGVFAIFAIIFFTLPYTLGLLLGSKVHGYLSRYCCSKLWLKLRPFFDAYNSPYKDLYRFWTGLLLLIRVVVLVVVIAAPDHILIVLITLMAILLTANSWFNGVYFKAHLNILESWFLMNILIVSALATKGGRTAQITTILSVSSTMLIFGGILVYHAYEELKKYSYFKTFLNKITRRIHTDPPSDNSRVCFTTDTSVHLHNDGEDHTHLRRETLLYDLSDEDERRTFFHIVNDVLPSNSK